MGSLSIASIACAQMQTISVERRYINFEIGITRMTADDKGKILCSFHEKEANNLALGSEYNRVHINK
jgi:hypothetical protein